jgi:hypothetical protein
MGFQMVVGLFNRSCPFLLGQPHSDRPRVSIRASLIAVASMLHSGMRWQMLPQELGDDAHWQVSFAACACGMRKRADSHEAVLSPRMRADLPAVALTDA